MINFQLYYSRGVSHRGDPEVGFTLENGVKSKEEGPSKIKLSLTGDTTDCRH